MHRYILGTLLFAACGGAPVADPNTPASPPPTSDDAGATPAPTAKALAEPAPAAAPPAPAAAEPAPAAPPSPAPVRVGMEDNGKTVNVKKGQVVVLALPENATTGFEWVVTRADKTLGQPKSGAEPADPASVGGGGKHTFTWSTASAQGSHVVELEYKRSFEKTKAAKTFKVTLKIE